MKSVVKHVCMLGHLLKEHLHVSLAFFAALASVHAPVEV